MNYLRDKQFEHEKKCEEAIRADRNDLAIFHAAKAAHFAFELAGRNEGAIATSYLENAESWLEIAERIKTSPPKKKTGSEAKKGAPTEDKSSEEGEEEDWLIAEKPNMTFDKIAGMETAKQTIREMVVYPMQQPEKTKALGLKPGGGVLLYGSPGNGKTLLGKAIANELDAPFFYASGAQLRSKWHGESEQRLRKLIQAAKSKPVAILFLDEVEGLLPKRSSGSSVVDNRIVTQFLSEIGGFEESDHVLLILGATNLPWDIDEAVFRTGRFDEKIYIPPPDPAACYGILKIHLNEVSLDQAFSFETWAERLEGYTGSDIVGIVNAAKRSSLSRCIQEDADPVIMNKDIEEAFQTIPSSITDGLLKKYEKFREARFN